MTTEEAPAGGPTVRLESWSVVCEGCPYTAPEARASYLRGEAFGHPGHPDGSKIRSSRLVSSRGSVAVTATGTIYALGEPDPAYRDWLTASAAPPDAADVDASSPAS